ncbi:hypothetical protein B0H66DRAFT_467272 [Apodospora peruviana]|uniref:Short-chain dehydrogenase/reductase n=1 Tax=Apodospora peruviana TaxID=516989 RepID=A0AAE0ITL0_9PEZI|nr:hypothetical protein B0H66DRAFT_467272 [Apodospora peruviana]
MSRPWILLCPSSRGIGHALTRHLLQHTHPSIPILATARSSDLAEVKKHILKDIRTSSKTEGRLQLAQLDVTDESTISAAAEQAASLFPRDTHHLHLAFALPGILHPEKSFQQIDYAKALQTYKVNVLGPMMLMKWFGDFLPRKDNDTTLELPTTHATWVTMSARVGSVSDNRLGGWYSYRSSKAAVNSLTKSLDHQLLTRSGDKAMAVGYHPGTVKTDLSKPFWDSIANDSLFKPADAAERMASVVMTRLDINQRGRCWDWKGEEVQP